MEKCKLCQTNNADKKNSHTIPKFFAKTMLRQDDNKFLGFEGTFESGGTDLSCKKIQDIHKEDYIFCSSCESDLERLETTFSNQVYNKLRTLKQKNLIVADELTFSEIPISRFEDIKRLIYSIIWRVTLNPNEYPQSFIGDMFAEKLRYSITQKTNDEFPKIWLIYSPENVPHENIINVIQNEKISVLFLNELIILISFDNIQGSFFPDKLAINRTDCPIILFSKTDWEDFKMGIMQASKEWAYSK